MAQEQQQQQQQQLARQHSPNAEARLQSAQHNNANVTSGTAFKMPMSRGGTAASGLTLGRAHSFASPFGGGKPTAVGQATGREFGFMQQTVSSVSNVQQPVSLSSVQQQQGTQNVQHQWQRAQLRTPALTPTPVSDGGKIMAARPLGTTNLMRRSGAATPVGMAPTTTNTAGSLCTSPNAHRGSTLDQQEPLRCELAAGRTVTRGSDLPDDGPSAHGDAPSTPAFVQWLVGMEKECHMLREQNREKEVLAAKQTRQYEKALDEHRQKLAELDAKLREQSVRYEASSKELQVAQATIEQNRAKSHDDRDKMAMDMRELNKSFGDIRTKLIALLEEKSSVESALAKLKETLALVQDQHVEGQVEVTTRIAEVSALIDGFDMKPDFEKLGSAVDVVSGSVADVATSLMEQSETQQQQLTGAVEQLNASFAAEVHKSEEVVMNAIAEQTERVENTMKQSLSEGVDKLTASQDKIDVAMAALHEMAADARMDPGELSTLLDDTTGVQIMEQLQAMRNDMQAFKEAIKSVAQKAQPTVEHTPMGNSTAQVEKWKEVMAVKEAELERAHQEIKHLKHVAKQATERHERIIVDLKRQIAQERDALNHQVAELKAKAAIPVAAPAPTTTSDRVVNKFAPKTVDLRKKTIGENGAATEATRTISTGHVNNRFAGISSIQDEEQEDEDTVVQTIIAHDLKKEKMQSAPAVQSSKIYHRDRKRASTHSSTLRNNMKKPKNQ